MDSYIIIIILVDLAVMIGMTVHGFHKGAAGLLTQTISLIAAAAVMMMLSGLISDYRTGDSSGMWIGILLLIVFAAVYKILRKILNSIRLLAGLPILSGLNRLSGLVLGFCEGFLILYIAEYLLRMYLLR